MNVSIQQIVERANTEYLKNNYEEAHQLYLNAAKLGSVDSQRFLGRMYLLGRGVECDYAKAKYWLIKSAENGDAEAKFDLGGILERENNYESAAEHYSESAKENFAPSMYRLAKMYEAGLFFEKNISKAYDLYKASYKKNNLWSLRKMSLINIKSLNPLRILFGVYQFCIFFIRVIYTSLRDVRDLSLLK